jgi:hypothetical protein
MCTAALVMLKKRYKKRRLLQTTGIKSFSTVQVTVMPGRGWMSCGE